MKIHIEKNPAYPSAVNIYMCDEKDGRNYIAKPMVFEFEEMVDGECFQDPTLQLNLPETNGFLKAFADALEEFGIFRKQDPDAMKYIKSHLEDMRRLVFEPITEKIEIRKDLK